MVVHNSFSDPCAYNTYNQIYVPENNLWQNKSNNGIAAQEDFI